MNFPKLDGIRKWIGEDLLSSIEADRSAMGEAKRMRKLGTTQRIWLFLNVSSQSASRSLHEIIKMALADLDVQSRVSVAAFCKARTRFSPTPFASYLGTPFC